MKIMELKIKQRFEQLISQGDKFTKWQTEYGEPNNAHRDNYTGWVAAVKNIVNIVTLESDAYRQELLNYSNKVYPHQEFTSILKFLLSDIEAGLITSIEDQTKAFVFDELLDHAKDLLNKKQKDQAGIIAGVAFEDTFRNICRKNSVCEKDVNLDNLISEIQKKISSFSQAKAKRARVAADVRTRATHAQWDEFTKEDVRATIEITEEFIQSYLN
jgi:hypothetical protein